MKSIDFSVVEASLPMRQYAVSMVELTGQFPIKDGKKTFEYAFKRQQPSKISIPQDLLTKLSFMQDDSGKDYLVIDGVYIERVTENGFKRIQLCEKYRPVDTAKTTGASVE